MGQLWIETIYCDTPSSGSVLGRGGTAAAAGLVGGAIAGILALPTGPAGAILSSVLVGGICAGAGWFICSTPDQMYMTLNGTQILPEDGSSYWIAPGGSREIKQWFNFDGSTCNLKMWDYDFFGNDDPLGQISLPGTFPLGDTVYSVEPGGELKCAFLANRDEGSLYQVLLKLR